VIPTAEPNTYSCGQFTPDNVHSFLSKGITARASLAPEDYLATLLLAKQLFTPHEAFENAALLVEDGLITAVGSRSAVEAPASTKTIDFGDAVLAPGLIDIHVHGGAGHDVMEGSDASLAAIERHMAAHGVTSYCPTTVTAPIEKTLRSLELLGKAAGIKASDGTRARPLGIHLEGPFLSHAKRGVHPPELLQPASLELFEGMWQAAEGRVNLLTIAPEIPGALDLITAASQRGICVSLGHSDADLAQSRAGIEAGARHATHTFNAMRALDHRQPGLLGAVLTDNSLTADIIADGIHVAPSVIDLFVRAKGIERSVLISDAISATGMPDGTYSLGGLEVQVHDGRCESGGRLAGSVLTLDRAVRNTMDFASLSLQHAIRMATYNPACVLGIEKRKGILAVGADADIAVFTPRGELLQTFIAGIVP
jgi:N-acetylglucosamine-6-phosphate deacetylase